MKAPIFLWEPATLDVFESAESARRYVEPVDVENRVYVAFDWDARRLDLGVKENSKGRAEVFIRLIQPEVIDRSALSEILAAALLAQGCHVDSGDFDALREQAHCLFLQA